MPDDESPVQEQMTKYGAELAAKSLDEARTVLMRWVGNDDQQAERIALGIINLAALPKDQRARAFYLAYFHPADFVRRLKAAYGESW